MRISISENRLCYLEQQSFPNFKSTNLNNPVVFKTLILDKQRQKPSEPSTKDDPKKEQSKEVAEDLKPKDLKEFNNEYFKGSLMQSLEDENYDFIGTGNTEYESRQKFVDEVLWIYKELKVNPLGIIWKEIFPTGSDINFTGGRLTVEEQNKNLEELNRVETWIRANLQQ